MIDWHALLETDGRNFMALLDMCHFIVNHITGEYDFKNDLEEASLLRKKDSAGSAKLTLEGYVPFFSPHQSFFLHASILRESSLTRCPVHIHPSMSLTHT